MPSGGRSRHAHGPLHIHPPDPDVAALFEGFAGTAPCFTPFVGSPITHGNVVIEAESLGL